MNLISIVIPCYNEEESIPYFYQEINRISKIISDIEFEYIFIDDGSKDKTLNIIKSLSLTDKRVKYISFSRNFGKEAAMYAGLKESAGCYIAIMDVDLQDPPDMLVDMYKILLEENCEYDCVATRRVSRKGEPIIRSFFAKLFYKVINKISNANIVDGARDYRLMTRRFVNAVLSISEYNRFSKGIFGWVGFKTKWLEFENIERVAGTTKWSFWKLFLYSIDGIVGFSIAPLHVSSILGIILCIISFIMILFVIAKTIFLGNPASGWASIISVLLFMGGLQLLSIGIIGQYISKTYLEVKNRPIYIIKDKNL